MWFRLMVALTAIVMLMSIAGMIWLGIELLRCQMPVCPGDGRIWWTALPALTGVSMMFGSFH